MLLVTNQSHRTQSYQYKVKHPYQIILDVYHNPTGKNNKKIIKDPCINFKMASINFIDKFMSILLSVNISIGGVQCNG